MRAPLKPAKKPHSGPKPPLRARDVPTQRLLQALHSQSKNKHIVSQVAAGRKGCSHSLRKALCPPWSPRKSATSAPARVPAKSQRGSITRLAQLGQPVGSPRPHHLGWNFAAARCRQSRQKGRSYPGPPSGLCLGVIAQPLSCRHKGIPSPTLRWICERSVKK